MPRGANWRRQQRLLVNALFYVLRTGGAWRYLPREYPPWQTAYTTLRQWRLQGGWQQVHETLRRLLCTHDVLPHISGILLVTIDKGEERVFR
jgi:putative transposase